MSQAEREAEGSSKLMFLEGALSQAAPGSRDWFGNQRNLIFSRPLLKACYDEWYRLMLNDALMAPVGHSGVSRLELGSGGSYLKELDPSIITSDVVEGVADRVIDARALPFPDRSLSTIFMTHALHHIPDVDKFLREADRTLVPGGVISLIEVANTFLARFFFKNFHPEPFDEKCRSWSFESGHNLMDANQALSWILFVRDREIFERQFPRLKVEVMAYLPWLSYLASGGVTRKSPVPSFAQPWILRLERILQPLRPWCALHWHIRIRKVEAA